jgi:hypothetical protein
MEALAGWKKRRAWATGVTTVKAMEQNLDEFPGQFGVLVRCTRSGGARKGR